jgi:hypothetical protein
MLFLISGCDYDLDLEALLMEVCRTTACAGCHGTANSSVAFALMRQERTPTVLRWLHIQAVWIAGKRLSTYVNIRGCCALMPVCISMFLLQIHCFVMCSCFDACGRAAADSHTLFE